MSKKTAFLIAGLFLLALLFVAVTHDSPSHDAQVAAAAQVAYTHDETPAISAHTTALRDQIQTLSTQILQESGVQSAAGGTDPREGIAKKRAALMEELAAADPQAFLLNVIPDEAQKNLSASVKSHIEKRTKVKGTVDVLHIDDFEHPENSRFEYTLKANGKKLKLALAGNAPAMLSGTEVQVDGFQIGETIAAVGNTGALQVTAAAKPTPDSVGPQSTLFILITSPGLPATPTKAEIKTKLFSGAFQQYYTEQSYGKTTFTGDVTDWISVPASAIYWCGRPDLEQPEVKNYLLRKGIDLARYGRVMFINNNQGGGCNSVGKYDNYFNGATYRLSKGWTGLNGYNSPRGTMSEFEYILAHEMGHGLGVLHAGSWECSGPSLENNCEHLEYGNPYDAMGNGRYSKHFNAFYKDKLGWLGAADKVLIETNGTYTLSPLEGFSGYRAGIISNPFLPAINPAAQPAYVEFRQPIGFDASVSHPEKGDPISNTGLHINQVVLPQGFIFPFTRIINANYLSGPDTLKPLLPGNSFRWIGRGITINNFTATSTKARFYVTLSQPRCVRGAPHIDVFAPGGEKNSLLTPQSNVAYWLSITNNDSLACPNRAFKISASVSDSGGWTVGPYPADPIEIAAGTTASWAAAIFLYVPSTATLGSHELTISFTDTKTGTVSTRGLVLNVTSGSTTAPVISDIQPAAAAVDSAITIKGVGFDVGRANIIRISHRDSGARATVRNVELLSNGTLIFTMPAKMVIDGKGSPDTMGVYTEIPTPPGSHILYVERESDGRISEGFPFSIILDFRLSAKPNPVIIPSGKTSATTTVSWYVPTSTVAQVWKSVSGTAPALFSCNSGPRTVKKAAPGITAQGATFKLYQTATCTTAIIGMTPKATLKVTVVPPPTATLSASPNPCVVSVGSTTCSTTLSWSTGMISKAQIWMTINGGTTKKIRCGGATGSATRTGIHPRNSYVFNLYATPLCTTAITGMSPNASVTVTANPATSAMNGGSQVASVLNGVTQTFLQLFEATFGWGSR